MDTDKIGKFIAIRRKTCGLTQQQLADELGITNKAISKWETGQGMPDVTALPLLADILGVSVDELLSGEMYENHNGNNAESIYIANKMIYWFRIIASLSVFFALMGNVIPFFMRKETSAIAALLFGCWFEICSIALFLMFYFRMKNEINNHNRKSLIKLNSNKIRNQFLRFELWLWLIVPSGLIVHMMLRIFSYHNLTVETVITFALSFLVGILIWIRFINEKSDKVSQRGRE